MISRQPSNRPLDDPPIGWTMAEFAKRSCRPCLVGLAAVVTSSTIDHRSSAVAENPALAWE